MDHPSKDWKDLKSQKLKKSKANKQVIDQHFRFSSLNEYEDFFKCALWEVKRTEQFLKLKTPKDSTYFPYTIKGFPERPYLSFSSKVRDKWNLEKWLSPKEPNIDKFLNLLEPHQGTKEEVELGKTDKSIFVYHYPTLKVPVELYIHPYWSSQRLVELFRKQVVAVLDKVKSNQAALESEGYIVPEEKDKKPIKRLQKTLKLLGHFRLIYCVKLNQNEWQEAYGGELDDYYRDIPTMLREMKRRFPKFKPYIV